MISPQSPSFTPPDPALWRHIPEAMRVIPQWGIATLRPDAGGKIDKKPYHPLGFQLDATNPGGWVTFDAAKEAAEKIGGCVGFRFGATDPFLFLDLDGKDGQPPEQLQLKTMIFEHFGASYSECSQSGKGVHIVLREERPALWTGFNRDGVELYRVDRFGIMTGDVRWGYREPISMNESVDRLVADLAKGGSLDKTELSDCGPERLPDRIVLNRMFAQVREWDGTEATGERLRRWHFAGPYPSPAEDWSKCDHAYLTAAVFESRGHWEQALRLFQASALWRGEGSRAKKYVRDSTYLNGYVMKQTLDDVMARYNNRKEKQEAATEHGREQALGLLRRLGLIDGPSASEEDAE